MGVLAAIRAERVGVYDDTYLSGSWPAAWMGRAHNAEVGHHQILEFSGTPNSFNFARTGVTMSSSNIAKMMLSNTTENPGFPLLSKRRVDKFRSVS